MRCLTTDTQQVFANDCQSSTPRKPALPRISGGRVESLWGKGRMFEVDMVFVATKRVEYKIQVLTEGTFGSCNPRFCSQWSLQIHTPSISDWRS